MKAVFVLMVAALVLSGCGAVGSGAARGVTLAAFKAIAPGKAHINAWAGPMCSPGQACPAYLIVITIDVTVNVTN